MKRIFIASIAIMALATMAFSQPMMAGHGRTAGRLPSLSGAYTAAETTALASELGTRTIGEMTVNELVGYGARIQLAMQKDEYVRSTAMMSMFIPGAGQLRNGDTAEGAGFIAVHAATIAGTLAGIYYLLPADLRFDSLDYISSSKQTIHDAWMGHSFVDYLPAMGAAVAGMLVDGGIRYWSATRAAYGAKAAIDSGKATLRPMVGPGYFGMGMHY